MKISVLEPDSAVPQISPNPPAPSGSSFRALLDQAANDLDDAQRAERAFVHGSGSLLAMTTARAKSDVDLSIAAAAASRVTQALSTFANMAL